MCAYLSSRALSKKNKIIYYQYRYILLQKKKPFYDRIIYLPCDSSHARYFSIICTHRTIEVMCLLFPLSTSTEILFDYHSNICDRKF